MFINMSHLYMVVNLSVWKPPGQATHCTFPTFLVYVLSKTTSLKPRCFLSHLFANTQHTADEGSSHCDVTTNTPCLAASLLGLNLEELQALASLLHLHSSL